MNALGPSPDYRPRAIVFNRDRWDSPFRCWVCQRIVIPVILPDPPGAAVANVINIRDTAAGDPQDLKLGCLECVRAGAEEIRRKLRLPPEVEVRIGWDLQAVLDEEEDAETRLSGKWVRGSWVPRGEGDGGEEA